MKSILWSVSVGRSKHVVSVYDWGYCQLKMDCYILYKPHGNHKENRKIEVTQKKKKEVKYINTKEINETQRKTERKRGTKRTIRQT